MHGADERSGRGWTALALAFVLLVGARPGACEENAPSHVAGATGVVGAWRLNQASSEDPLVKLRKTEEVSDAPSREGRSGPETGGGRGGRRRGGDGGSSGSPLAGEATNLAREALAVGAFSVAPPNLAIIAAGDFVTIESVPPAVQYRVDGRWREGADGRRVQARWREGGLEVKTQYGANATVTTEYRRLPGMPQLEVRSHLERSVGRRVTARLVYDTAVVAPEAAPPTSEP